MKFSVEEDWLCWWSILIRTNAQLGMVQIIDVKNINLQIKKHKNMFFQFYKKH